MPIDPYAALNAMLRAEVTRFAPPARQTDQAASPKTTATATATAAPAESERQQTAPADSAA
ncbi:hypothetical protein OG444_20460 [Streptomyces sp. NBC_01232]|uniref:hypothetical protein n=1 Tax=unclassified Streptomyces TaxID=2593676 RepID=UPI002E1495F3|nr:hypothetical protein OG444_20460 [Streptomyces sp. NBC_01232]